MVFTNQGIKDISKILVGIPITSVDSTVLVVKLNSTSNSLDEGESRGLGLNSLKFLPFFLGDMLGNKGVLGLNIRERSIGLGRHSLPFSSRSSSRGRSSSTSLQLLILLPQLVDTVNHLLDKLNLGVSKSVLVGDIVGVASLSTRFALSSTGLQVELLASGLQSINRVSSPARQVDVNRCSHASTKIGGAGVDVSVFFVQAEVLARFFLDRVLHNLDTLGKSSKDSLDISTLLHGDDAELILLINPNEESLVLVVEDATTLRPVSLHTSNSQVSVSRDEQEMVIDQLLANIFLHASEGVVFTSKVSREILNGALHQLLNSNTLFLGDSGGEAESINGASDTDAAGVNWDIAGNISSDLGDIHVRGVSGRRQNSVVLLDQGVEHNGKVLVGVPVASIHTAVLVVKFNSASNSLVEGESGGLGLDILEFVPLLTCHVFGDQGVP